MKSLKIDVTVKLIPLREYLLRRYDPLKAGVLTNFMLFIRIVGKLKGLGTFMKIIGDKNCNI